jgi:hypothetical protein
MNLRALGTSVSTASNWVSRATVIWAISHDISSSRILLCGCDADVHNPQLNSVIIAQITPYGFSNLSWKYFFVYMATNLSNCVICYLLFPETKNKTLEEIGLLFGDTNVRMSPTASIDAAGIGQGVVAP